MIPFFKFRIIPLEAMAIPSFVIQYTIIFHIYQ